MSILSSNRPIPNLQDQHTAFENQFSGMTVEPFTYEDFGTTRKDLIALFFKRWEGFPNFSGGKLRNGHAFVRILSAKFNSIKKHLIRQMKRMAVIFIDVNSVLYLWD